MQSRFLNTKNLWISRHFFSYVLWITFLQTYSVTSCIMSNWLSYDGTIFTSSWNMVQYFSFQSLLFSSLFYLLLTTIQHASFYFHVKYGKSLHFEVFHLLFSSQDILIMLLLLSTFGDVFRTHNFVDPATVLAVFFSWLGKSSLHGSSICFQRCCNISTVWPLSWKVSLM